MKENIEYAPDIPLGLLDFQVLHAIVKSHLWSLHTNECPSAEDAQRIRVLEPLQVQLSTLITPDRAEESRYLFWTLEDVQAVREALDTFVEFLKRHAAPSPERNEVLAVLAVLKQRLGQSIVSRLN
jgi:hypothetical protein